MCSQNNGFNGTYNMYFFVLIAQAVMKGLQDIMVLFLKTEKTLFRFTCRSNRGGLHLILILVQLMHDGSLSSFPGNTIVLLAPAKNNITFPRIVHM